TFVKLAGTATVAVFLAGCGGSGPSADQVAREANAEACTDSGYAIIYRADQSKHTIWDCQIGDRTVCVGEDNGIASDITVEARLVFANALGGNRPDCLG